MSYTLATNVFYSNNSGDISTATQSVGLATNGIEFQENLNSLPTLPTDLVLNATGISYDDGTTTRTTTWTALGERVAYLEAVKAAIAPDLQTDTLQIGEGTGTGGKINISNALGTGTAASLLTLNQTAATGLLYKAEYNKKTPAATEAFRQSFYADTGTATDIEHARVHIDNIDFSSQGLATASYNIELLQSGNMTPYLSCNSSTNYVESFKPINMNTNGFIGITDATTILGSKLAPQKVEFLTADTATPTPTNTIDLDQRQVYVNTGVPYSWATIVGSISPFNNITCAENDTDNNYTLCGTDNGNIFYSGDSGATWTQYGYSFQGQIKQLKFITGYGVVVVGDFYYGDPATAQYGYVARINNWSSAPLQYQWGNGGGVGFNNNVNCVEIYGSYYLYFGGEFTADASGALNLPYFSICDTANNYIYSVDNLGLTSTGVNGVVYAIKQDMPNTGRYLLGGNFTQFEYYGGIVPCNNLIEFVMSGYTTSGTPDSIVPCNNVVRVISQQGSGGNILVGGDFTSNLPSQPYNYAFNLVYTGGTPSYYQVDYLNPTILVPNFPVNIIYNEPSTSNILTAQNGGDMEIYYNNGFYGNAVSLSGTPKWNSIIKNLQSGVIWVSNFTGTSNPHPFYYQVISQVITITISPPQVVWYNGSGYSGTIILGAKGVSIELVWNITDSAWYVVGYTLATFT